MSKTYPGGLITKTPVTPAGPYETGAASGVWTLDQQLQYQKQGIWPTQGNVPNYIEDVFSTYLYTGNGSTQTITNGIDLAGKGGLTWIKARSNAYNNYLFDTARGANNYIISDYTGAQNSFGTYSNLLTSFNSNGFSLGADSLGSINVNAVTYVSWTFRKQPKFFDVVTYTGNGTTQNIPHNLGSVPGCIIVKNTNSFAFWRVYHTSLGATQNLQLQDTGAAATQSTIWNNTAPTATQFTVGSNGNVNESGSTMVAYLFAHNAGGFGLTGTDNVISCGSFTTDGSGSGSVTLGYEPQWWLVKDVTSGGNWQIFDTMRGNSLTRTVELFPDTASAEGNYAGGYAPPNATGFSFSGWFSASSTVIYIAIRRGPMKVPTLGTSVYMGATRTGNGAVTALTAAGFPPDLYWAKSTAAVRDHAIFDRLRGPLPLLSSNNTQNEIAYTDDLKSFDMTGVTTGTDGSTTYNQNGVAYVNWYMRRAPGFFDEVCYTGTGVADRTVSHNLTVAPELMIVKTRSLSGESWIVWSKYGTQKNTWATILNGTNPYQNRGGNLWGSDPDAAPSMTATTFRLGDNDSVNVSAATYVAYLFATAAGVSKVGSYTGTGATQTISCGFTGGSRLVLIKRTDSTGNWVIWDTARGMVSGTDPYLNLNTTAAEVNANNVYTTTGGFQLVSSDANFNANGGSYIFLAVA